MNMKRIVFLYLTWGWPLVLLDGYRGWSPGWLNTASFLWILCLPVIPVSLLLDRVKRERAMARLCGLREGDERERSITGEAARATLLLSLSLQVILLVLSLVSVRLSWDPNVPKGEKHGTLSLGLAFSTEQHLDPFGAPGAPPQPLTGVGAVNPAPGEIDIAGGFLLAPSTFPVLLLLILAQLAAFRAFALRRYEGQS